MSYAPDTYERDFFAADAAVDERVAFLRRVYLHVFGAVVLLAGLCAVILKTGIFESLIPMMSGMGWIVVLGLFMLVSYVAQKMAYSGASVGTQYAGLGLYVAAEALIFTPLIYFVNLQFPGGELFAQAGFLTLLIFAGLTTVVFMTKADFSFLRGFVVVGSFVALGLIVVGAVTGFDMGLWLIGGIIALSAITILYQTSEIMRNFPTSAHVAASLALFASVATLYYHILMLLARLQDD